MSNLKWFGKICLALAAALEFGRILRNITNAIIKKSFKCKIEDIKNYGIIK